MSPSEISAQLRALRPNTQDTVKSPSPRAHTPRYVAPAPDTTQRRAPPPQRGQADQIELAVLAAIYQKPKTCLPIFAERGRIGFLVNPVYRSFLQLAQAYFEAHSDIEPNAFLQYLLDTGQLQKLGGPGFIAELLTTTSPPEAFTYHLDILRDKYVAREIAAQASKLATSIVRVSEEELWTAVADHERAIADLRGLATDKLEGVENFSYADLLEFDASKDSSVMLGSNRWLGRGYTCLWAGASGAGKSTLEMQAALYWATGTPLFGIPCARPLKSLILQAENDLGDTGEQLQGVIAGIRATGDIELNGQIGNMVVVNRIVGRSGDEFLGCVRSLIKIHSPDLVWIDPFFAFAGCDLVNTEAVSRFLRHGLIPLAIETGVCVHVIHHARKSSEDSKSKSHWAEIDYQYLGFGSSEIQNSFRAVNILLPVPKQDKVFRLILSKRGTRAGAKSPDGEPATSLYLSHSKSGNILWSQVDKPEAVSKKPAAKRNTETQFQQQFTEDAILEEMSVVHPYSATELRDLMQAELGMKERTFYRLWATLKPSGKIKCDSDRKWTLKSTT